MAVQLVDKSRGLSFIKFKRTNNFVGAPLALIIKMGVPISSFFLSYLIFLCLLFSLEKGFGLRDKKTTHNSHNTSLQHTYGVKLSSLLPASVCSPSTVPNNKASLKVVHKHGPCSQPHQDTTTTLDHAQILQEDQSRVKSIHARLAKKSASTATATGEGIYQQDATTLPAKSGAALGTGNYIVTVGLGTPKRDLTLLFDTGSDLTWTQCQPCARSCYDQRDAIFDPSKSTSYSNISCTSPYCPLLESATGNKPTCSASSSTCIYGIQYGDQSFSVGYLAKDKLTLSPSDVIGNFYYGCGQNNQGLFGGSAGILGLGRNKISIVEQTAQKYNRLFSYCLPSSSSSMGYLSFGRAGNPNSLVKYTPFTTLSASASFYALQVLGISVGGKRLSTPASLFQSGGAIIDSGTVITRLPPTAYSALKGEFKKHMSRYPSAPALSILDTCFNLTGLDKVTIPKISFFFSGRTAVDLDATGILYGAEASQVCLAFAGNSDDGDLTVFGNVQQKTLQVVYDIGGGRIGFGSRGC